MTRSEQSEIDTGLPSLFVLCIVWSNITSVGTFVQRKFERKGVGVW
jgi:hypothetical protein